MMTTTENHRWYLGFDCATKTFAFSLSKIDAHAINHPEILRKKIDASTQLHDRLDASNLANSKHILMLNKMLIKLHKEAIDAIQLVDGETVDLTNGDVDGDIATIDRIRRVTTYVRNRILPLIDGLDVIVVIEYQMGQNMHANIVANTLATIFIDFSVSLIVPTLKNKIHFTEQGRYCYFIEKYSRGYANKVHVIYNFNYLESIHGTKIKETIPAKLRGHIADSMIQVLAFILYQS
jgi:hypothetical protein